MAWADLSRTYFEEKMLWACVLRRTIFDYALYRGVGKHKLRWQQAHQFIFVDEEFSEDDGLTFVQICGLFGWDPEYLRRKVRRLERKDIKRLESSKFKECFDGGIATVLTQNTQWESGQSVPIFIPYNCSSRFRERMQLRSLRRKNHKLFVPRVQWALVM